MTFLIYQAAPAHCDAQGETGTAMVPGDNGGFLETGAVVTAWSQAVCSWRLMERDLGCRRTAPAAKVSQQSRCRPGCLYRGDRGSRPGELLEHVDDLTSRCVGDAYRALCAQRWGDFYPEASLKSLLGPT